MAASRGTLSGGLSEVGRTPREISWACSHLGCSGRAGLTGAGRAELCGRLAATGAPIAWGRGAGGPGTGWLADAAGFVACGDLGLCGSGRRSGLVKGPFPGQPGNKPHGCFSTVFPQHFVPQSPPHKGDEELRPQTSESSHEITPWSSGCLQGCRPTRMVRAG